MASTQVNPELANLVRDTLSREGLKSIDGMRLTGLDRGTWDALYRGEVKRVHPEVANVVCKRLGIRMERFLRACGYDIPLTPAASLPEELVPLVERWPNLHPEDQDLILRLARRAPRADAQAPEKAG